MSELKNKKSEMSEELRTVYQKYETDLKAITISLEEEKEKVTELESLIKNKEATLLEKENKWEEMETQYK